jgi:hypothetical protein
MRAMDLNPYYAPPYMHLGHLLERSDRENAITSYQIYLERAARSDTTRHWVAERLRTLQAAP